SLKRPITCTLQGEDLFLDGLVEPYRAKAIELIRRQVADVDRFIPVSDYYVPTMSRLLEIPVERMTVVPLGINLAGYEARDAAASVPFRIGYFARIAPEKGLHVLAQAYRIFRRHLAGVPIRLEAAGYLSPAHAGYLDEIKNDLQKAGLDAE